MPLEFILNRARLPIVSSHGLECFGARDIDTDVAATPRHTALVRVTHWLTVIAFLALLVTGVEILISHPRFYWGETGNSGTAPLFTIHIPSSRDTVPSGYNYVLPDQNGWSRYLHFQAAWLAVLTGLVYFIYGVFSGHFRKNLVPPRGERSWRACWSSDHEVSPKEPPGERAFVQRVAANRLSGRDLRSVSA